jgi:hypothetical protein
MVEGYCLLPLFENDKLEGMVPVAVQGVVQNKIFELPSQLMVVQHIYWIDMYHHHLLAVLVVCRLSPVNYQHVLGLMIVVVMMTGRLAKN